MAVQITNYQCPACTGPLHYGEASGKLECEFCGSSYSVEEIEALFAAAEEKAEENFDTAAAETVAARRSYCDRRRMAEDYIGAYRQMLV